MRGRRLVIEHCTRFYLQHTGCRINDKAAFGIIGQAVGETCPRIGVAGRYCSDCGASRCILRDALIGKGEIIGVIVQYTGRVERAVGKLERLDIDDGVDVVREVFADA